MCIYRDQLRVPDCYWFDPFSGSTRFYRRIVQASLLQGNSYLPCFARLKVLDPSLQRCEINTPNAPFS